MSDIVPRINQDTTSAERVRCEYCGQQVIPLILHPCVATPSVQGPERLATLPTDEQCAKVLGFLAGSVFSGPAPHSLQACEALRAALVHTGVSLPDSGDAPPKGLRIALQAILGTAGQMAHWGDAELDVWVRQLELARSVSDSGDAPRAAQEKTI